MSARLKKGELSLLLVFLTVVIAAAALFVIIPAIEKQGRTSEQSSGPSREDLEVQRQVDEASLTREQAMKSSMSIIGLGETFALSNEGATVPFVPWNGTMEVSVEQTSLYQSFEEAQADNDLGTTFITELEARDRYGAGARFLVVRLEVKNIDASNRNPDDSVRYRFNVSPVFNPLYLPDGNGLTDLGNTPWTAYFSCPLATFDGSSAAADERSQASFDLAPGEEKLLIIGFWVPVGEGASQPECTDFSTLVMRPSLSSDAGPVVYDLGLSE